MGNLKLSYTSLNAIHNGHEWLNKQMGIPVPDYTFLKDGKDAHRIIQDHVAGIKKDDRLSHIEINFPIVETEDFDPKCKFEVEFTPNYTLFGYIDGLDPENKRFLEIKTSSVPWSMQKFKDAMQRKVYALALLDYKEAYLITCKKDPNSWDNGDAPKLFSIPITEKDREDAHAWIADGIARLEEGDFKGGLDENGKCTGCFWNMPQFKHLANCHFM